MRMRMREIIDIVEEGVGAPTYTQQDFDLIAKMREQNLSWPVIATRLGRPEGSLRVQWHNYKTGKWKNRIKKWADEDAALERDLETYTTSEIAKMRGVTRSAVNQRAAKLGLDKEMRDELRAEKGRERVYH